MATFTHRSTIVRSRGDLLISKSGYLAETFSRSVTPTPNGLGVSGTVYYCAMPLEAGDLISFLGTIVSVAGATVTVSKLGLYHPDTAELLTATPDFGTDR